MGARLDTTIAQKLPSDCARTNPNVLHDLYFIDTMNVIGAG